MMGTSWRALQPILRVWVLVSDWVHWKVLSSGLDTVTLPFNRLGLVAVWRRSTEEQG